MQTLPSEPLGNIACDLAALIDQHAGDYPIVSLQSGDKGLRWFYANLVIDVLVVADAPAQFERAELLVTTPTLGAGLELIARTEANRQGRDAPFLQFQIPDSSAGNAVLITRSA
jgi:hypothetical protein